MLGASSLIAFVATTDGARARSFYEHVLGLKFVSEDDFAFVFDSAGAPLRIQKVQTLTPQPYTVLGWAVRSIDEAVKALEGIGITLERYAFLEQDEHGVWRSPSGAKVVWLKDPDGNLLSLSEPPPTRSSNK
jgi:catechol 2,3-dioxygenase-like lactoylglutathione lyase family enzyme